MAIYRAYFIQGPQRTSWADRLRLAAAGLIGLLVVGAAVVLSLSLLLVLIPLGFVAFLFRDRIVGALLRRAGIEPQPAAAPSPAEADGTIIETDYRVVESDRRDRL